MRLVTLFLLVCAPAFAVKEFYSLSRSVRALGTGGAFYGLSDDESALFYNPAGLSLYPGGGQLMFSFAGEVSQGGISAVRTAEDAFRDGGELDGIISQLTSLAGQPISVGVNVFPYYVKHGLAVGLLVGDLKANVAVLGRDFGSKVDMAAILDSGLFIGMGRSLFHKALHFGVNVKGLHRAGGEGTFSVVDFAQRRKIQPMDLGGSGFGFDADLGATWLVQNRSGSRSGTLSVVFNNLMATQFMTGRNGGAPPGLVRTGTLGSSLTIRGGKVVSQVRFLLDLAELDLGGEPSEDRGGRKGKLFKHINLGVEAPLWGWLYLRGGFHQGLYTLGLGITAYALKLDFATYGEELGHDVDHLSSRRYALRLALGFGAPSATEKPRRK